MDNLRPGELGFTLEGQVPIRAFETEVNRFRRVLEALAEDAGGPSDWVISRLNEGSAELAALPPGETDPLIIRNMTRNYSEGGERLAKGQPAPDTAAGRLQQDMVGVVDGNVITGIKFSSSAGTYHVKPKAESLPLPSSIYSYDAIEGKVSTLQERPSLRFVLYETLFGRGVTCHLDPEQENLRLRDVWRHRAIVYGRVRYDALSGHPMSIRNISEIEPVDEPEPYAYRKARGILKPVPGEPSPVDFIRGLRERG